MRRCGFQRAPELERSYESLAMMSPLEQLHRKPSRFSFRAATRLLWLASRRDDPGEAIRFASDISLAQPSAEVSAVEPMSAQRKRARLQTAMIGLIGPSGTMPRWYTEQIALSVRNRAPAVAQFFDLIAQRLIAAFVESGAKYRPHLAAERGAMTCLRDATLSGTAAPRVINTLATDPVASALLALSGFGSGRLLDRLDAGGSAIQHYAGFYATQARSAERLAAIVSDWLGRRVTIIEFAGLWLNLDPGEQSRMPKGRIPGQFNRLGSNCAIGTRAFDQQARFILRIGPLDRAGFESLLPDQPTLRRLVSLVRAYVGMESDFAVNLVLDSAAIPTVKLGGADAPRLSWTGWLPRPAAALTGERHPDQALFPASLIEQHSKPITKLI